MTLARAELEERIVQVLRQAGVHPLSLPQIQEHLVKGGFGFSDGLAVRDAVWQLIRKRQADLTPRRYVRIIGS